MKISLIAAMSNNWVIGRENDIPWQAPGEQSRFRDLTTHRTIIMGRKTFESIGRALPNRRTIVITSNSKFKADGCTLAHSLDEALQLCLAEEEIFIAGGESIYSKALPLADQIYLTVLDLNVVGDTYFPQFSEQSFKKIEETRVEGNIPYTILTFERILDGNSRPPSY